ncbi:hypothetical protein [Synechococcus phage S-B68]|nr:hypothetical protein [Synechococcus phage S-B68]
MRYAVYAARPEDLEAGFEPFLEGRFDTEAEAIAFAAEWNRCSDHKEFWVETL